MTLRRTLGVALVLLAAASIYMSWGALYEFALACGFPPERAVVFPVVIDTVTLVAMLIAVRIAPTTRREAFYPWLALVLFGAFTIVGNAMHVVTAPAGTIAVAEWVAIVANAMPAIASMVATHLAAVTVFSRTATTEPAVVAAPEIDRAAQRTIVLALSEQGRSIREIEKETGVPRTTVTRWVSPASA